MRVLHVIPSVDERSGGPASAIVPMCRALQQQGIEVWLVTTDAGLKSGGKPPLLTCSSNDRAREQVEEFLTSSASYNAQSKEQVRKGGLPPLLIFQGVPIMLFPSQLGASFKYSHPLSSWLRANIRQFDLVHIHAVFNHSSVTAAHACRKANVPYLVRPLGTLEPWSMAQKSVRKRLFWQVAGKAMLRRAAAVHYTTEAEKLTTQRLLRLNHGKVIGLGIANGSSTLGAKEKLASCFPELAQQPYVLVLSRLHPKKGLDVLLDAFSILVQQPAFAHWKSVIAGDGPAEYVSMLKQKSGHGVQFTGWLDGEKKDAMLSNASLLALPSHQENFGLCVMEALSHAVPVLVSPHVNLAEEIVLANAGWISTVDKDALSTRLAEALADPEELGR